MENVSWRAENRRRNALIQVSGQLACERPHERLVEHLRVAARIERISSLPMISVYHPSYTMGGFRSTDAELAALVRAPLGETFQCGSWMDSALSSFRSHLQHVYIDYQ
jgi:hypothetical protein